MKIRALFWVLLPVVLTGCPRQRDSAGTLTASQALSAVNEASLSAQSESFAASAVEITTSFTLGQGVESAALELRSFIASQLPCAQLSVSGARLEIAYGVRPGACSYRGHRFSGQAAVEITKSDPDTAAVTHTWTNLSNGHVTLNGSAEVRWDFGERSRRVVHQTTWTRAADGLQGQGEGDVTQTVLDGGLQEGIRIDGSRSWTGARGAWDLGIDRVEMRWVDPIPQAGTYTLNTPYGKSISLTFSRLDERTLVARVESGRTHFSFHVTREGFVRQTP